HEISRKTTNRLRAIETSDGAWNSVSGERGRKTTNRLRAIETNKIARMAMTAVRKVARPLIAFGRVLQN
ncbi:MAG: hypothetical protein WAU95_11405, partial [Anaerolineae bacterium]